MRWIELIREKEGDAFFSSPFIKEWDERARAMGSNPVARTKYGDYQWRCPEWHVFLRPYGTWSGNTYENTIELQSIQVTSQRQGVGQKLMTTLCALADKYHVP